LAAKITGFMVSRQSWSTTFLSSSFKGTILAGCPFSNASLILCRAVCSISSCTKMTTATVNDIPHAK
jgi:hypothetical protein